MYNSDYVVHELNVVATERVVGCIYKPIRFSVAVINDGIQLYYGNGDRSQFFAAQMASTGNKLEKNANFSCPFKII